MRYAILSAVLVLSTTFGYQADASVPDVPGHSGSEWSSAEADLAMPGSLSDSVHVSIEFDSRVTSRGAAIEWVARSVGAVPATGGVSAAYTLLPHRWTEPGPVGFYMDVTPMRTGLSEREVVNAVSAGAYSWNSAAIGFQFLGLLEGPDTPTADGLSTISFSDTMAPGIGAYAITYCRSCSPNGGGEFDIVHRVHPYWSTPNSAGLAFDSVLMLVVSTAHEFGHVAGLNHAQPGLCTKTFDSEPVMCASSGIPYPGGDDSEGLMAIYGRAGPAPRENPWLVWFGAETFSGVRPTDEVLAFVEGTGTVCGRAPATAANGPVPIWIMSDAPIFPGCGTPGRMVRFFLPRTGQFVGEPVAWRSLGNVQTLASIRPSILTHRASATMVGSDN